MHRVALTNLNQFQENGDRAHLRHLAGKADAILVVEGIRRDGKPVDVDAILGRGWACNQDTSSADRAGSCVAWRRRRLRGFRSLLRLAFRGRQGGTRARWISVKALRARGVRRSRIRFAAAHYAPRWADHDGSLRDRMRDQLEQLLNRRGAPYFIGADVNHPIRSEAAALGMEAHGVDVMAVMYDPTRIAVQKVERDRTGIERGWTDHADLIVTCRRIR